MRTVVLDDLLKDEEPGATFHDALVERYSFDARLRALQFHVQVSLYADAREPRYREGILTFSEVASFHVEPPAAGFSPPPADGLWLTSDGPVESLTRERSAPLPLPEGLPDGAFHHYLYFSDLNSFIFISAARVEFRWREGGENRGGYGV